MRLQSTSTRNCVSQTAWGPLKFDENGIAEIEDAEGHAALLTLTEFTDPDNPQPEPEVSATIAGESAPAADTIVVTRAEIAQLQSGLETAHGEIAALVIDSRQKADHIENQNLQIVDLQKANAELTEANKMISPDAQAQIDAAKSAQALAESQAADLNAQLEALKAAADATAPAAKASGKA